MTLKELTEKTGWTLNETARRCGIKGVDAPLLSKIRSGIVEPSAELQAWIDGHETELGGTSVNSIELTDDQITLLMVLSEADRERPVTKEYLCRRLNLEDRVLRKNIQELRNLGVRVVSCSNKSGYWLDEYGGGYDQMRKEMHSRAMSILTTISKMDRYDKKQLKMEAV